MKKKIKRNYENIIDDLEKIIVKLNSAKTPIEESINLFEKGIKLSEEADKELVEIEKNIEKNKKIKKSVSEKIDIEKTFKEIEKIVENIEDQDISIEKATEYYLSALDKISNIESYLKKAKSIIKKYEQ
tara:strand:- start:346 stop:732 length:387 start_codon:yes stop_codon:yes gene_type:complete